MPFTVDQFFGVFLEYNQVVYPAQIVLFGLACFAVYFAAMSSRPYDRLAAGILAFFWLWMAIAYHLAFFWKINPAALLFAVAFIVQALLLLWLGIVKGSIELRLRNDAAGWIGGAAILYALIVYPILCIASGHPFPEMPTFGLPCPTTIFTIGLLLWARPYPYLLLIIPWLWALVGTLAAISLQMPADFGLTVSAILALGVALERRLERVARA